VAPPPPAPHAGRLLAEARSLLAGGDAREARARIAAALLARPTPRQQAIAELLSADALLVERRRDLALAAYRRVADIYSSFAEGETAAYAAAQLLVERGSTREARAALETYVARYPAGRFVREAREKLATLPSR
jgi:TolA-binding protein